MKLGEITTDQIISLTVTRGNTSASLSTDPAFVSGDTLYVKPFTHNGAIISFDASELSISMMAVKEDSVPYFWQNVRVTRTFYNGEHYHCISSNVDGVRLNRRTAFRVFVGDPGDCTIVERAMSIPVTIRDVSATGIGFLASMDYSEGLSFGTKVRLKYSDEVMGYPIDVTARIVRIEKADNATIYGCEFSEFYPKISQYVTAKQLKLRKTKR